jgi:MFS family permease
MIGAALARTFEALRHRNFRLYLAGNAVSNSGTWMQKVAQAWLVLELTGSGTMLGLTAAAQQLPMLLIGPWGGLLSDRFDKRKILLWTTLGGAIPAVLLGVLTATGTVQLWTVWALALFLGCVDAVEKPARHSFAPELVPREHVTNAVTLSHVVFNVGKVIGPAAAGIAIVVVGLAASFFVNAASYLAVLVALLLMRTDQLKPAPRSPREWGQLREGLRYIRNEPEILAPLLLLAVTGLLVYEWTVTLPLLARNVFDGDAGTVGLLFSSMGLGAVLGGLAVAGTLRASPSRLAATALVLAALLVAVAMAPTLSAAVVLLFLLGGASVAFRTVASSWLQLRAEPQMRGRVIAWLLIAVVGTSPVGGPLLGWIGDTFGARAALAFGGLITAAAAAAYLIYLRIWAPRVPATATRPGRSDAPAAA